MAAVNDEKGFNWKEDADEGMYWGKSLARVGVG